MGKDKKRHNSSESDDSPVRKRDRYLIHYTYIVLKFYCMLIKL